MGSKRENGRIILLVVALIVISFLVSTGISLISIRNLTKDKTEEFSKILSTKIHDQIQYELAEPIMASKTMANDSFLVKSLKEENEKDIEETTQNIKKYLYRLKDRLSYESAFVVSDRSRRYYTAKGLNKVIDPENNKHDLWYSFFLEKNREYDLDVDSDEMNDDNWTIFVNTRIEDEDGNFLGVCGFGVQMNNIQKMISEYEQEYGIKINLINTEGLVQVDTDEIYIENAYLKNIPISKKGSEEYTYQRDNTSGKFVVTKYVDDLGWYLVVQECSETNDKAVSKVLIMNLISFVIMLSILFICIHVVIIKDAHDRENKRLQDDIISAIAGTYLSIHYVDLQNDTYYELQSATYLKKLIEQNEGANKALVYTMMSVARKDYRELLREFTDLKTLPNRMKNTSTLSLEFIGTTMGWCRASFTVMSRKDGELTHVIFGVQVIDEEKKYQEQLMEDSMLDALTGLHNRRAFEKELSSLNKSGDYYNKVFAIIDINGLKDINDDIGHAAGDEMICGTAGILRSIFSPYGYVFRTGGDEFCAILDKIPSSIVDLKKELIQASQKWSVISGKELSMACGIVAAQDYRAAVLEEILADADNKMYEDKENYYKAHGIDRRARQLAYDVLCNSYINILKVNLTKDTYQILSVNKEDKNKHSVFVEKISAWFKELAEDGTIHQKDTEQYLNKTNLDYLRRYFSNGNESFCIYYRRLIGGTYKRVMMEMILDKEDQKYGQLVYLYVKQIEV